MARIAEDEAVARKAQHCDFCADHGWYRRGELMARFDGAGDVVEFIVRHDPARVLAECEAKRRIVEARPAIGLVDAPPVPGVLDAIHEEVARQREYVFRWLALPYADHPDYRPEWKP